MQGFNMGRYVPPDLEGTLSANQVSGKHALGNRARKSNQGILTVRFEMPFAVWCSSCPQPTIIGQGVRFNAEKKRAGAYHSTPIWSFRMKHVACGGWIEIRTDPANTDYVVAEGGKRRDTGVDKVREGDVEIRTEEEKARLKQDAFAALEVKIDDRRQADAQKARIEELYADRERDWEDPYSVNKRLRRTFRVERKELEREAKASEALKDRMSLGIELLNETEEDRRRAAVTEFGSNERDSDADMGSNATTRPLFQSNTARKREGKQPAAQALGQDLARTARAQLDIFGDAKVSGSTAIPGIKRKRKTDSRSDADGALERSGNTGDNALVSYDSD